MREDECWRRPGGHSGLHSSSYAPGGTAGGRGCAIWLSGRHRRRVREPTRTLTKGGTMPRGPHNRRRQASLEALHPSRPPRRRRDPGPAGGAVRPGPIPRPGPRPRRGVHPPARGRYDTRPDPGRVHGPGREVPRAVCGSGNFLTEVLRRKLRLVAKANCVSQEQYEQRLLRAAASIYGVDISPENVTEARGRMAHVLLEHYQADANTIEPTTGFLNAAALILGDNIVLGDTLNAADQIELCDWRPHPGGRFQRVWTYASVPPADRHLSGPNASRTTSRCTTPSSCRRRSRPARQVGRPRPRDDH